MSNGASTETPKGHLGPLDVPGPCPGASYVRVDLTENPGLAVPSRSRVGSYPAACAFSQSDAVLVAVETTVVRHGEAVERLGVDA